MVLSDGGTSELEETFEKYNKNKKVCSLNRINVQSTCIGTHFHK